VEVSSVTALPESSASKACGGTTRGTMGKEPWLPADM
jgi:hypothetical protein